MEHFEISKRESNDKINKLYMDQVAQKKQIETLQSISAQLRKEMDRVDVVSSNIHKVEVEALQFAANVNKNTNEIKDALQLTKLTLESRIDQYKLVADKVDQQDQAQ